MLSKETTDLGIEIFGTAEIFQEWLNSKTIAMSNKPINYPENEIYTELQRIVWEIY